ncbi:hypothetical protein VCUG_00280 [Vavraia culicis subsp. floridensis]|uniref:Uncharacterized protein n=1 Tax=Vavraia culicis (isolate floridensis) TaxID=948595 RepID=L2GX68_VAVCU|nr:uncharacterized protein VCUG_00280 [Vavraia culicis subsp. floridensis]ELA48239.1 hypothetical protein VCUG_00280 [Vavraia culicis subsp. floridensis]
MQRYEDAEEYEKSFLKKYLTKKAMDKLNELEKQLKNATDTKKSEITGEMEKTRLDLERSLRLVNEMEIEEKNNQNYDLHAKDGPESFVYLLGEVSRNVPDEVYTRFVDRVKNVEELYKGHFNVEDVESHILHEHVFIASPKDKNEPGDAIYCPAYIYNFLLPFQQTALKWFCSLFLGKHGGILADEMGLGKTIQAIAFLSSLLHSNRIGGALILCPSTLLEQWFLEIRRIYPFVRTIILHNNFMESVNDALNQKPDNDRMSESFRKVVVVASYEGFKTFFNKIRRLNLDVLILDEGHKIKNFNTQTFKYIKTYNILTYILTGTPVQNNLKELWSLFNITNKHLFGTYTDFYGEFEEVILKSTRRKADKKERKNGEQRTTYLKSLIAPYILRRTKKGTNLPKKCEKIAFCPMTNDQISLYKEFTESKAVSDIIKGNRNVFYGLDILRKITNHPSLYKKGVHGESGKMHMLETLLTKWCTKEKNDSSVSQKMESGEGQPINKVLVFSQSLEMLNIIENFVISKGYTYLRMDGTTSLMERKKYLDMFTKENYFVFLLTTRVGGIGLNLTAANKIVIYDPDWNPSIDKQASERSYRFGQKRDVEIIRFITRGTIEEKIYEKQIFKNLLAGRVLGDTVVERLVGASDLKEIFTLGDVITEGAVEDVVVDGSHRNEDKDVMEYEEQKVLTAREMLDYIKMRESTY